MRSFGRFFKRTSRDSLYQYLRKCSQLGIRKLRTLLRLNGIWVRKDRRKTVAESLYNTLQEEDPTEWTTRAIEEHIRTVGRFNLAQINYNNNYNPLLLNPYMAFAVSHHRSDTNSTLKINTGVYCARLASKDQHTRGGSTKQLATDNQPRTENTKRRRTEGTYTPTGTNTGNKRRSTPSNNTIGLGPDSSKSCPYYLVRVRPLCVRDRTARTRTRHCLPVVIMPTAPEVQDVRGCRDYARD
jgi:hypothetical protein